MSPLFLSFRDHPGQQSSFTEKCSSSCAGKGQALGRRAKAALPWLSVNLTMILLRTQTSEATPLTSSGPSASSHGPGLVCLPFEKALRATNACWTWKCEHSSGSDQQQDLRRLTQPAGQRLAQCPRSPFTAPGALLPPTPTPVQEAPRVLPCSGPEARLPYHSSLIAPQPGSTQARSQLSCVGFSLFLSALLPCPTQLFPPCAIGFANLGRV